MDNKDYYSLLNIKRNAAEDDIKKAYRTLARQFHPDVNLDKDAEERFKLISAAYAVLSDNEKRQIYDKTGKTDFSDMDKDLNAGGRGMGRCQRPFGGGKCSGLDALFRRRSYHGNKKPGYIPE